MQRISAGLLAVVGALAMAGCGFTGSSSNSAASGGGLAVLDLDAVAKSTGRSDDMAKAVKLREAGLNQQLAKAQAEASSKFEAKKAEFGEQPSDEQKKQLLQMQVDFNSQLGNLRRQAQAALEQFRQDMVVQFRNDIRPVAYEVASAKGLSIVIPKNEGFLLSVDPGVDITNEVVHKMRTAPKTTTTAAAPAPAATSSQPSLKPAPAKSADRTAAADKDSMDK